MEKKLLIVKACNDSCSDELNHIITVADMFRIEHCLVEISDVDDFMKKLCPNETYDYLYLAAHADMEGFGDSGEGVSISWEDFAWSVCESQCLNMGAILLLACCRGGLQRVALQLFTYCLKIDYVCGPRWTVTADDITTGFHVFLYNMEVRNEQPSTAATRASRATGYDFFCYDRIEVEDEIVRSTLRQQLKETLMCDVPQKPSP